MPSLIHLRLHSPFILPTPAIIITVVAICLFIYHHTWCLLLYSILPEEQKSNTTYKHTHTANFSLSLLSLSLLSLSLLSLSLLSPSLFSLSLFSLPLSSLSLSSLSLSLSLYKYMPYLTLAKVLVPKLPCLLHHISIQFPEIHPSPSHPIPHQQHKHTKTNNNKIRNMAIPTRPSPNRRLHRPEKGLQAHRRRLLLRQRRRGRRWLGRRFCLWRDQARGRLRREQGVGDV